MPSVARQVGGHAAVERRTVNVAGDVDETEAAIDVDSSIFDSIPSTDRPPLLAVSVRSMWRGVQIS